MSPEGSSWFLQDPVGLLTDSPGPLRLFRCPKGPYGFLGIPEEFAGAPQAFEGILEDPSGFPRRPQESQGVLRTSHGFVRILQES
eukprot:4300863-Pyramimonas_sp.AAC.1